MKDALIKALRSASNAVAGNVAGPVDLISMGLRGVGVPVPQNAIGGSEWMRQRGLLSDVPMGPERIVGETLGLLGPTLIAAKAPQIARGLLQGAENLAAPRTLNPQTGAIVWHGSPHKFDKFDSSKIGTGEGAQAYGHGLYLAESPKVAQSYKNALSHGRAPLEMTLDGAPFPQPKINYSNPDPQQQQLARLRTLLLQEGGDVDRAIARTYGDDVKTLEQFRGRVSVGELGSLYKVDLPDEAIAKMLDWDKPLHRQAPQVRRAVRAVVDENTAPGTYAQWVRGVRPEFRTLQNDMLDSMSKPAIAEALRAKGIPGIRYLDGGSRGAGQGTSNYVVFPGNEGLLTILERNGQRLAK